MFLEATYKVSNIRAFIESNFIIREYMEHPQIYFDNSIKPVMNNFIYDAVNRTDLIRAAFFTLDPNLAGFPLVNEIFFENTEAGIIAQEPETYEEYLDVTSGDMDWFYASFNSSKPQWTPVYEWDDGVFIISYTEPVIIDGRTIGVAGIDMSIQNLAHLVRDVHLYDSGFAVLADKYGGFFESNSFIAKLSDKERESLLTAANQNSGRVFKITINGADYLAALERLLNDYQVLVLVPRDEVYADVTASITRFVTLFVIGFTVVLVTAYFIVKPIAKPLVFISALMNRVSGEGDLSLSIEEGAELKEHSAAGDEIGQTIRACNAVLERLKGVSKSMEILANGDLTSDIEILSGKDIIGLSVQNMNSNLNNMFIDIKDASTQVSSSSGQLANGAKSLAGGANQQAASTQELSSAISEISQKIKNSARVANEAGSRANKVKDNVEKIFSLSLI
jgi:methyl-accepting chemotaxis protein